MDGRHGFIVDDLQRRVDVLEINKMLEDNMWGEWV